MLGIVILLCGVAGLAVSGLTGALGIALYRKLAPAGGWLPFWSAASVMALLVIAVGVMQLAGVRHSPPRAEDFTSLMKGVFLFGAAPGAGMLAAAAVGLLR